MENRGLLFVPDISGFTNFVNQVEIEHSRMIIQELLEVIINANEIGLKISEIEGDAVLFYKFGEPPSLEMLYDQVQKMFLKFHQSLLAYDVRKYCQCNACTSAIDLSLKVISHYGEFTSYNVRNFEKLIGKDVIVVHQLLKNEIDNHEYWLVTNSLTPGQDDHVSIQWTDSSKKIEGGSIPFRYANLSSLRSEIKPEPIPTNVLQGKTKIISVSKNYDTDIISLFHASGDFSNRARWVAGVKEVKEVGHLLPRIGMRCRSIMENGEEITYSSSYSYNDDRIEFCETEETSGHSTYFILEKVSNQTRLTLNYYIKNSLLSKLLFRLRNLKTVEQDVRQSLENLVSVIKVVEDKEKTS